MPRYYFEGSPNRYICSAIDEMRKQLNALDKFNLDRYKSMMAMLIEEVQTLANAMESGLEDWSDLREMRESKRLLKNEIKKLKAKKDKLTPEKDEDEEA